MLILLIEETVLEIIKLYMFSGDFEGDVQKWVYGKHLQNSLSHGHGAKQV